MKSYKRKPAFKVKPKLKRLQNIHPWPGTAIGADDGPTPLEKLRATFFAKNVKWNLGPSTKG